MSKAAESGGDELQLCYSAGVMILSKEHPQLILYRWAEPVLTPESPEEVRGTIVNVGKSEQAADAETTPLRNPEEFQFDLNLRDIAEVWRRGSVISSWLLDLTASALLKDPTLAKFDGRVSDSGEGRWTIKAAIDEGVPVPVLSTALYSRFSWLRTAPSFISTKSGSWTTSRNITRPITTSWWMTSFAFCLR